MVVNLNLRVVRAVNQGEMHTPNTIWSVSSDSAAMSGEIAVAHSPAEQEEWPEVDRYFGLNGSGTL